MEAADKLHSASIHLLRHVRKEDETSGVTASRLSALSVVVYAGPLTLGELAAAEQVRPPTMTKIVYWLEDAGLARRSWDEKDRRSARLAATARGRRVLDDARRRRIENLAARLGKLRSSEVALLAQAAELIEQALRDDRSE